jgi:ubiquinone/menaquinone biosynthesis C-methylase UbiE
VRSKCIARRKKAKIHFFYRDGRIYDVMHEKLVADTNFFVEEAVRIGGPVLEVACGTGRITIPFAKKGIEIVGLDISEGMLNEVKKKSDQENLKIEWVRSCPHSQFKRSVSVS